MVAAEMVIIVLTILAEEEQVLIILPVFADNGVVGGHRGNSGLHRRSVIANVTAEPVPLRPMVGSPDTEDPGLVARVSA